jgi:hypothetical protein
MCCDYHIDPQLIVDLLWRQLARWGLSDIT